MVKLLQISTVVRDGFHNMLTDLAYWKDYYWLAYRRVSGHYSHDGGIVILRSVDLKRWHEVAYIKTIGCDWAPRFCATNDRLFVYFFTAYPNIVGLRTRDGRLLSRPKTLPDRHSHVSFTDDGIHWSQPTPAVTNKWLFGIAYTNQTFYGVAYAWQGDGHDHIHGPLSLLTSEDGLSWQEVSIIAGVEEGVDEADLFVHPDGEIWVISAVYKEPKNHSLFFASKPPYHTWERMNLNTRLSSPIFCECGGTLYVAGRRWTSEPWIIQPTPKLKGEHTYAEPPMVGNTAIWTVEKGKVTPFFALPSIGDHWQPGLLACEANRLIISYNSQHAYLTGVLPSKIPIPFDGSRPDVYVGDDDIYIAELEID